MATVLGAPLEFDWNTGDWEVHTERLAYYFAANGITSEDRKPLLLSACGSTTYKLIKSLVAPASVTTLK